ncbi:MAG: Gfo/Idh/MocA family protein [Armatimonadota bacterium]
MKKKIGFIDYFIDEWHANNYPQMIRESSLGDKFEVTHAWEEIHPDGKMHIDDWCKKYGVARAESIEQVVEECDCIVVLSPDNVERHEDLARIPLMSGKPVYIDKPFAPSLEVGRRMVELAAKHNTPLMSSSALRFDSTVQNATNQIGNTKVHYMATFGPGTWEIYAIHQIEPIVAIMATGARRVIQCGNYNTNVLIIAYENGRRAILNQNPNFPFRFVAAYGENGTVIADSMSDFFPRFIESMLGFFESGKSPIPIEQTLEVTAILEAGTKALQKPNEWVDVPA